MTVEERAKNFAEWVARAHRLMVCQLDGIRRRARIHFDIVRESRDAEWSKAIGAEKTLTPRQAKQWLAKDRVTRARHVADCSRFKGRPKWY